MPVRISCPCGAKLSAPARSAGRRATCPKCGARVQVPDDSTADTPPAANIPISARQDAGATELNRGARPPDRADVMGTPVPPATIPPPHSGGSDYGVVCLKCPSCGSGLQARPDDDVFPCRYCGGSVQVVRPRGDGAPSLRPVLEAIERVHRSTDRTASELAVRRLKDELAELGKAQEAINADRLQSINASGVWCTAAIFVALGLLACGGMSWKAALAVWFGLCVLIGLAGCPKATELAERERRLAERKAAIESEIAEHLAALGKG